MDDLSTLSFDDLIPAGGAQGAPQPSGGTAWPKGDRATSVADLSFDDLIPAAKPPLATQPASNEPKGWYESTAETARDAISNTAVGRGFTAGMLKENPDNLGNAVEGFGYLSGSTWAVDQGKSIQDWAKTAGGVSKQGAGILDSDSLDSFLTNVGETLGSGLASTVPSVVAGVGGAAAGGAVGSAAGPVGTGIGAVTGGVVGAGSTSYVQSFGELFSALKEAGVDPQRAAELSKYGAVPIASLDMIGLGAMAKPFVGEVRREVIHGLARRIATEAAKGATAEGLTESAQEFLKDAIVTTETDKPLFTAERAKGWAEAGIGGALVGGVVDASAGARRPEARRDPNAPDPALPPPKPGDIESPIPTADIQRGRAMMDALIEGRMEEAMGLGRPGQAPAPAAPGPAPSAPMPEPVAPRGYEPLYDDEDPELQVGWINPRTGDVRRLEQGGSDAANLRPDLADRAGAAPALGAVRIPGEQDGANGDAQPAGAEAAPALPPAPSVVPGGEDRSLNFDDLLPARPTADDVRPIGVGGRASGGMVQPITAPASLPAGDGSRATPVKVEHPDHVEVAAARAQTAPSDGQKEAGNYQKGHLRLGGMDITIETPKDAERSGTAPDGTRWSVKMPAHYGYVKRSEGADGDQVDVYIGPEADTGRVFVFDQFDPKTRRFDEHKAVLGVRSIEDAQDLYDGGFSDGSGPRRRGGVTEMSTDEFRTWAMSGDTSKPLGEDLAAAPVAAPAATPETMDRVTGFRTAKGSTYTIDESGRTVRDKAARNDPGHEGDSGVKPVTARTVYLDVDASQLSAAGLTLNVPEKGARVAFRADGKAALLTWNPKANQWGKSSSWLDVRNEPAVGRYPLELWKPVGDVPGYEAYGRMHAGNKIVEIFSGNRQDGVVPPASVSTTPEPQKSATDRVPEALAGTTLAPAETKIEKAKRRAREMVVEGKTTGDIQRTLRAEGASNVEVTAATREAGKAQAKAPETTPEIAPKSENPPATPAPAGIVAPTRDVQDRSDLYAGQLAKAERALKQLRSRRAAVDETGKDPLNPNRSASLARGFLDDDISNKENTIKNLRQMLEKAGRLPSEARSEAVDSKPAKPEPIQGYSDKHPDWATSHEQDVGGKIVYSDDDMALLEGFSQINGRPVFLGVDRKMRQRTRVDIEGYTGPMFSAERKAVLVEAKARQVAADEASHAARPDGPFRGGAKVAASDSVPTELVSVARDWLKMLGIDARVFITTLPDANSVAQADKHGLYGPFAAVRSAGVDGLEKGSTRRLSNGDNYIAVDLSGRRSAQLETLAHEIGHILEKEAFRAADAETKAAITGAYEAWLKGRDTTNARDWIKSLRAHTVGKLTPVLVSETATGKDLPPYWSSFNEWFADQVSRWATSSEAPVSVVDRFFSRIARGLRRLYASAAGKKLLPTSAMQTWLDGRAKENTAPLEATPIPTGPDVVEPPAQEPKNQEAPKPEPKPKRLARKPKPPSMLARMENYFRPGRVVPGYGGTFDKVMGFRAMDPASGRWQADVIESDSAGNPVPGARPRSHSSMPRESDLRKWERENPPELQYSLSEAGPARAIGLPASAGQPFAALKDLSALQSNPDYRAAKAGDTAAAGRLVRDLMGENAIEEARRQFGPDTVFVPAAAEEASGRNKIPTALAEFLAAATGGTTELGIVQSNRAFHTGADPMERMIARARFDGEVTPGARYVVVDDVSVLGSTLADLSSHIQAGGGEVIGAALLVNRSRSGILTPKKLQLREVTRRFGDAITELFDAAPEALTADEAAYLLNFRDAQALRDRVASARERRSRRLAQGDVRGPSTQDLAPAGWGEVEAMPTPNLSAAEVDEIAEIVRRVAGLEGVRIAETIPIPVNSPGAKAWGRTEAGRASAFYNGVTDAITIALDMPEGFGRRVAYHESFHRLQRVFLTDKERAVLKAESDRLREIVAKSMARGRAVADRMAQSEVEAEAFSLFTVAKEQRAGTPITSFPLRVRPVFAKLDRIVRAVRNWLNGRGFQTYEDVFGRAAEGRTALRTARGMVGTTVMDDFFSVIENDPRSEDGVPTGTALAAGVGKRIAGLLKPTTPVSEIMAGGKRRFLDFLAPVDAMVNKAAAAAGLEPGQRIQAHMDVYLAARLAEDTTIDRMTRFDEDFVRPLVETMRANGVSLEDLHSYLLARHAPERNAKVAERYAEQPDHPFAQAARDDSVAGGSGISNAEAARRINQFREDGKLKGLRAAEAYVRQMVDRTRSVMLESGLISEQQYDALTQSYSAYVPLMGEEAVNEFGDVSTPPRGKGFNVKGKDVKGATGRFTEAQNIPAWVIANAQRAMLRAGKNQVGKTALSFARTMGPEFAEVSVADEIDPETGEAREVKNPREWRREVNPRTGQVQEIAVPHSDIYADTLAVKVGGMTTFIRFRDEDVGRALKKLGMADLNAVLQLARKVTVWQSIVNTRLNPTFMPINFIRDAMAGSIHLLDEGFGVAGTARILADIPSAMRAVYRAERGKEPIGEWGGLVDQYKRAGGKIVYTDYNTIEDIQKRLQRDLRAAKRSASNPIEIGRSIVKWIGDANDAVDNGIRLATFAAARRELGKSSKEAALMARDLTVDFKKRGEVGPAANALFAFFNASIQGNANILSRLLRSKAVRVAAGAMIMGGFLQGLLNAMLSSGGDDEEEDAWAAMVKYKGWATERSIVIFTGPGKDDYFSFPLPYGYNAFHYFGLQMSNMLLGYKSPMAGVLDSTRVVFDAYNPLGSGGSWWNVVAPTLADPFVDLTTNRNFMGTPIYPEQRQGDVSPRSEHNFERTHPVWVWLAKSLNAATGGNDIEPGAVDWSGDVYEHLWGFVSGGIGRFASQATKVGNDTIFGGEFKPEDAPIIRQFYGRRTDADRRGEYFKLRDIAHEFSERRKAYLEQGRDSEAGQMEAASPILSEVAPVFDQTEKALAKLRRARNAIRGDKSMAETERETLLKENDAYQLEVMNAARAAYASALLTRMRER